MDPDAEQLAIKIWLCKLAMVWVALQHKRSTSWSRQVWQIDHQCLSKYRRCWHRSVQTLSYQLHAVDPEGTSLNYQVRRGPNGMVVDAQSGLVTWTPLSGDVGTALITLAAFDEQGAAALVSFEIDVLAANHPPVIASTPPTVATARGVYSYDVLATDQDLDPLVYTMTSGPSGMTSMLRSSAMAN